jgi:hypothetical protein
MAVYTQITIGDDGMPTLKVIRPTDKPKRRPDWKGRCLEEKGIEEVVAYAAEVVKHANRKGVIATQTSSGTWIAWRP